MRVRASRPFVSSMAVVADTGYRALTEACGLVDRSERGKLALTGTEAKTFLHGQLTNDIEGLEPGRGCYAAFLTHKGKMLGDLRVLDLGDELLLDTERVALQPLFNMIRRYKLGMDVELHKRTLELALLSLIGPETERFGLEAEHANRRDEIAGQPVVLVRTDVGVDVFAPADGADVAARARTCRGGEDVGRGRADRARPAALRHRPRRRRDPAGGRAQRARGVVHQGLLRRPGDRRPAALPRQAEPPPARRAAVGAGGDRRRAATRREGGRAGRLGRDLARASARSRSRSSGARPRPATRWRSRTAR